MGGGGGGQEWLDKDPKGRAIDEGEDYFNADMEGRRKEEPRHGGLQPNPSCHALPRHVLAQPVRFGHWLPDCLVAHGEELSLPHLALPARFSYCAYDHPSEE